MNQLLEKAQQFVDKLNAQVKKRDPLVDVRAQFNATGLKVIFVKDEKIVDSYNLIEHINGEVEAIRDWNGVL